MSRSCSGSVGNYVGGIDAAPTQIVSSEMTLFAWAKWTSLIAGPFVQKRGATFGYGMEVHPTSKLVAYSGRDSAFDTCIGATTIPTGVWVACGMQRLLPTSGTLAVWLNGVKDGQVAATLNLLNASQPFRMGDAMNGLLADVALWDVGLTDAEMAALGKGMSPLLFRRDHLRVYFPLLGVAYPEANLAASGYNATQTGTVPAGTAGPPIGRWKTHAG